MIIEFRDMVNDDYKAVQKLFNQVAQIHIDNRSDIYQEGESLNKKYFKMLLSDDNVIPIVALKNNEILGISILSLRLPVSYAIHKPRQIGNIDTFCIDKKYKQQGIGQRLFDKTIDMARECNVDTLELMVWDFNKDAISFYEKMGLSKQSIIMEIPL